MAYSPTEIEAKLDDVLLEVQRPARYIGGELNSIVKEWRPSQATLALAFPDIYDLGMSNLGLGILYDLVNKHEELLAERVYLPWEDMEAVMQREGLPLYSLETKHPVTDFDVLGISLPYEQLYTNVLHMLALAGIPLRTADRQHMPVPLVIAGGHATYNPEPMADFIDAFVIGEGEDAIVQVLERVREWKASDAADRLDLKRRLARLPGLYVPEFYEVEYAQDGTLAAVTPTDNAAQFPVLKTIVKELPPPLTRFIVPFVDVVHNRAAIEIMRGCTRGCRFCHAGMVTRPVRERSVQEVTEAVGKMIESTGFEEVALLSLSSSDYRNVSLLVDTIAEKFGDRRLNISLPSLRIESVSVDLMDTLNAAGGRKGGFTLAPEAATENMREIINKAVPTQQVLDTAREIYSRGWKTIKLYFMIGHPAETLADVQAIADLCKAVRDEGRKVLGNRAKVHAGVSTFVPKPHTPFQWSPSDTLEQIRAKQELLRRELRGPGIKLNLNQPLETMMEAWLSRGDRRLGAVIEAAYLHGARFDAWWEHFNHDAWMTGFAEAELDPAFYTHRERTLDEILPWDHIDAAVKKKFLWQDWKWSQRGKTRVDCRDRCYACGILPKFINERMDTPAAAWECPEVIPKQLRGKKGRVEIPVAELIPLSAL